MLRLAHHVAYLLWVSERLEITSQLRMLAALTSLSKDAQFDRAPRDFANIEWQCCQPEDQLQEQKINTLIIFKERERESKNWYPPGLQSVSREQIESKTFDMVSAGDQLSFNMSRQMTPWLLILQ